MLFTIMVPISILSLNPLLQITGHSKNSINLLLKTIYLFIVISFHSCDLLSKSYILLSYSHMFFVRRTERLWGLVLYIRLDPVLLINSGHIVVMVTMTWRKDRANLGPTDPMDNGFGDSPGLRQIGLLSLGQPIGTHQLGRFLTGSLRQVIALGHRIRGSWRPLHKRGRRISIQGVGIGVLVILAFEGLHFVGWDDLYFLPAVWKSVYVVRPSTGSIHSHSYFWIIKACAYKNNQHISHHSNNFHQWYLFFSPGFIKMFYFSNFTTILVLDGAFLVLGINLVNLDFQ